jgi:hypothetical protein
MSRLAAAGYFLAAVLVATAAGGRPAAAEATCPQPKKPPTLELDIKQGTVKYDFTRNAEQLAALGGDIGGASAGGRLNGLTRSSLSYEIRVSVRAQGRAGAYCGYLDGAKISMGYREFEVYVNSRYPAGSCPHGAVLAHENEHVAVHRRALLDAEADLRARILAAMGKAPIVQGATMDQVRDRHMARLEAVLGEIMTIISTDAKQRNAPLDTPENYRRVSKRCSRW